MLGFFKQIIDNNKELLEQIIDNKEFERISKKMQAIFNNQEIKKASPTKNSKKPKPLRNSFWLDNITNLAHSYLARLCVDSGVEIIDKGELRAVLKSLRFGGFNIDDYINHLKQWQWDISYSSSNARDMSSSITQTLEEEVIKNIYANAKAKLQDTQAQIKLKKQDNTKLSLLYALQKAKIQAILSKIKE